MLSFFEEQYEKSLNHYHIAIDIDKELISKDVFCYIASKVDSADMFWNLYMLYSCVKKIQRIRTHKPMGNSKLMAHYTNLHSTKKLVQNFPFKLYNSSYTNDPEEGETLLNWLKENGLSDQNGETQDFLSRNARSPAYVGSFVEIKTDEQLDNGKLILWRTYGKHDGHEAAGAFLCFDISRFADDPTSGFGDMRLSNKEPIYEIVYKSDINNIEGLFLQLKNIAGVLIAIRGERWNESNNNHLAARDLLDGIRFLFKEDHYREEEELRMVKIRYFKDERSGDVNVDIDRFPPRFYMEAPEQLQLQKVILGPQAQGYLEWEQWIKEQNDNLEIVQSSIKYGRRTF